MKSTKTREAEDGTQTKISAFFKKPGTERPQSKLFSSIGVPSLEKKDNNQKEFKKSTDRKVNSKGSLPVYKGTMESCLSSMVRSVRGESEGTKDLVERGKSKSRCLTILKDMSTASAAVYTTPQNSVQDNPNLPNSPEVVIIPDTPEHRLDKGKGGVRAKTVCRSFLRPVSLVTTMPGKKVVFSSSKQKRVQKKSSGYVSVQFRGQGTGSIVKTSEGQMAEYKSSHEEGESDEYGFCSGNLGVEGQLASMTTPEIKSDPKDITDSFVQTNHVTTCLYQVSENAFEEHVANPGDGEKQTSTPKKLYSDGKTIKRMAKSGISPVSKRATSSRTEEGCGTRVICAKRQLVAMTGFTDVKEMNKTVNRYQITGSSLERPKDPVVTCKDDSILVELLEELSPFVMAHQSMNDWVKDTQSTTASMRKLGSTSIHKGKKEKNLHPVPATVLMENGCEKPKKHARSMDKKLHQQWDLETTLSRTLPISSSAGCLEYFQGHDSGSEISSDDACVHKTSVSDTVMDEEMQHFRVKDDNSDLLLVSLQEMGSTNTDPEEIDCSKLKDDNVGMFSMNLRETGLPDTNLKKVAAHLSSSTTCNIQDKVAENLSSSPFTDLWNRCIVCAVSRDPYTHELHLELAKVWGKEMYQCILQEFWSDTHIEPGDTVNIIRDKDQSSASGDNVIIVNNISGQIVVNPDLLLSGTTVVSGVHCLRRSILNEKFKGLDGKNNHMLYGSVIHSLFQEAVKNRLLNTDEIMSTAEMIAQSPKFLHEMYGQGVSEAEVLSEVQSYIEPLRAWQKQYMYPDRGCNSYHRSPSEVSVVKIHDIEETIWSPRYGIKGKIDMTVEVKIQKGQGEVTRKVLPLELKTGKASYSVEHTGQVTLYSVMMSDRRDDPKEGLLLYLKQPEMKIIPVKPANKQGLLQLRNEMSYYIRHQTVRSTESNGHVTYRLGPLPEPINNFRTCSKCPQLLTCTIFQRAVEDLQLTEGHAMRNLVPSTLSHLSTSHLQYFTHWFLCMQLEHAESNQKGVSGVWRMSSEERENQGDCLQQMVIANTVLGVPESQTFTDGKGCCVRFQRKPGYSGCTISAVGIHKNDSVVISSEDGRLIALSTGFVKDISEDTIEVVVDRDSFHDNRDFLSEVFRIDRCETYNTASYLMSNLALLMEAGSVSQKLRSLIIDKKKPEFNLTLSKVSVGKVKKIFQPLNKPQKTAVLKVLMAKDYVLIKGYPGTGKTSTIVGLVKILRELGHSVLLTSYTHSAVDNILLKLKEEGVRFLRLGRSSRVHPDLQNHVAENLTLNIKSLIDLKEFYNSYAIVATSCLGTNHPVFQQRKFDVCIVDEASQVLQPACLGPLFHAEKFVLVGDPNQLPPVVQSADARSLGMEESLFTRLDGTGATYELSLQYRMNRTIVHLANNLVYNGALQCGSSLVAQATVQFGSVPVSITLDWMRSVLDTSLTKAVVFLDTSQISAPEISDSRGIWNKVEASIIVQACNLFVQAGMSACDIGVIAPYRSQVQHLRKLISREQPLQGLEINTVDQYQGRDKSVICISFVRSCAVTAAAGKSSLLQDVRRLNVAVTRAQHKLVLIGNAQTLSQYQPLQTLLKSLQERQQIISLPADMDSSVQPEQNL